jgi:hypothetical protein
MRFSLEAIRSVRLCAALALLCAAGLAEATASLTERTQVAMLKVQVRTDQKEQFEKIMDDYYSRCTGMFRREARTTPDEIDTRVPRLLHSIGKDTIKKMKKVLDPTQMQAFEYALDLEQRRFMEANGVHDAGSDRLH